MNKKQRIEKLRRENEQYLRSVGYTGKRGAKGINEIPSYRVVSHCAPTSDRVSSIPTKREISDAVKKRVSDKYVIGQAYNKSGFQVLSRAEASDPATGKRR